MNPAISSDNGSLVKELMDAYHGGSITEETLQLGLQALNGNGAENPCPRVVREINGKRWEQMLEDWERRFVEPRTMQTYGRTVRRLCEEFDGFPTDGEDIVEWVNEPKQTKQGKPTEEKRTKNTRKAMLSAVLNLYRYLVFVKKRKEFIDAISTIEYTKGNDLRGDDSERHEGMFYQQALRFYGSAQDFPFNDRLIVELGLEAGLRNQELINLPISCVREREHEPGTYEIVVQIDTSKTSKKRRVRIPKRTYDMVMEYVKERRPTPKKPDAIRNGMPYKDKEIVFISRKCGQRLSDMAVNDAVKRVASEAGIESLSYYDLRHTHITSRYYMKDDEKLLRTKDAVGHAKAETTERYIHTEYAETFENAPKIAEDEPLWESPT